MSDMEYKNIGGWLYVLGFGLAGSCLATFAEISTYLNIFKSADILKSPHSTFFIIDFVRNIFTAVGCGFLFVYFLNKSKNFPRYFKIYLAAVLVFHLIEFQMISVSPSLDSTVGPAFAKGFLILLFWAIIWFSYFKFSKRAKCTFLN